MKVLFAVWECAPFIKVGGLGDVAHSLPRALLELGVDIRVVIPHYKALRTGRQKRRKLGKLFIEYGGRRIRIQVFSIKFLDSNIEVYLFKNRKYLDVPSDELGPVFSLAVIEFVRNGMAGWMPDIIHCNDHHTGFIPLLIKMKNVPVKSLITIHSLKPQGRIPSSITKKMGIDSKYLHEMFWETKKRRVVPFLEGLIYADRVNTVSPTYAKEILTEEFGAGLDDFLRGFPEKISGILNGIDHQLRDPQTNKLIKNYDWEGVDRGKAANKKFLQTKLGFSIKPGMPLIGFVGRLDPYQKGIDVLHRMMLRSNKENYQFVIMGEGQAEWEEKFGLLASFYPKNISYIEKYSDEMAAQLYAACDFMLIPSRFEPCCLIQMIAMRYGTISVARKTGGLNDTITDGENGFLFEKATVGDLEKALSRAVKIYKEHPVKIHTMRQNAMTRDFSWKRSANKYLEVYQDLLK